jgi:poly(A) polymerase/tRNA nucleotidyltransferase (CCA-adding enzyme)
MERKIPQEILEVLIKLQKADFEAYLVGGCVRDLLFKRPPKDWDVATDARPEEIQNLFDKSVYENNFGTVGVVTDSKDEALKIIEITPFRLEAKYSDKRHPDEVKFAGKLEDDLKRRDFTVNAMALKLKTQNPKCISSPKPANASGKNAIQGLKLKEYEVIDLFGGQNDLKSKIIRTVGNSKERFNEDALRIIRAVRLAAELNFKIERKTETAIKSEGHLLRMISHERIRDEFVKILMSKRPDEAIEQMHNFGILKYIIPELEEGWGVKQNKHHIYTIWEHNIRALMHAVSKNWPLDIRIASLLHDIGKPRAKRGEGPDSTFYGHEVIGAKMTAQILSRLKFSKKFIEKIIKLVRWHLFFSDTEKITLSAVRRIIRNVGPENIWDLMKVRFTDRVGMGRPKEEPYRLRKYEAMVERAMRDPISVKMLAVNGEDIMRITGIKPGPKIGFLLNILLDEVLDDPKFNTKKHLKERIEELSGMRDEDLERLGRKAKEKVCLVEEKEVDEIHKKYRVK